MDLTLSCGCIVRDGHVGGHHRGTGGANSACYWWALKRKAKQQFEITKFDFCLKSEENVKNAVSNQIMSVSDRHIIKCL